MLHQIPAYITLAQQREDGVHAAPGVGGHTLACQEDAHHQLLLLHAELELARQLQRHHTVHGRTVFLNTFNGLLTSTLYSKQVNIGVGVLLYTVGHTLYEHTKCLGSKRVGGHLRQRAGHHAEVIAWVSKQNTELLTYKETILLLYTSSVSR